LSLISLDDVRAELPNVQITQSSVPNQDTVTGFIANTEAEVRALLEACPAPWPVDTTSVAGSFLKLTILEGVRWRVLRTIFTFQGTQGQSPDVNTTGQAYEKRLGRLCDIARALRNELDEAASGQLTPGSMEPAVALADLTPNLSSSAFEYTQAVDVVDTIRTLNRSTGRRPWPLT
jgi:hypothetical protein